MGILYTDNSGQGIQITSDQSIPIFQNVKVSNSITTSSINTSVVNNSAQQTTIAGSTAGTLVASMPEQGPSYKKVIIYANGYENDTTTAQTYTFPVPFTNTPAVSVNSAGIPGVTVSTTSVSIDPDNTTAYTGWLIIEGF